MISDTYNMDLRDVFYEAPEEKAENAERRRRYKEKQLSQGGVSSQTPGLANKSRPEVATSEDKSLGDLL